MKLAQLYETAVAGSVSASSIASPQGRLFDEPTSRIIDHSKKVPKIKKYSKKRRFASSRRFVSKFVAEGTTEDDLQELVARMQNFEKHSSSDITKFDISVFGLEDDEGNIIKVYVKKEHAEEFSAALDNYLDQAQQGIIEVPEILFELKDRFDIIDVVWPQYVEDEEISVSDDTAPGDEEFDTSSDDVGDDGDDAVDVDDGATSDDVDDASSDEDAAEGSTSMTDILNNIINMMTTNAEATKAEAQAREAQYTARAAEATIKNAEERSDMDEYYSRQAADEKEQKELQKLVQYRSDVKRGLTK